MRRAKYILAFALGSLVFAGCSQLPDRPANFTGNPGNPIFTPQEPLSQRAQVRLTMAQRFARDVPTVVTFEAGRARLSPQAQAVLSRQALAIKRFPELSFRAYGHADQTGRTAVNDRLAAERARVVAAFLIHKGVPAVQIAAVQSFGSRDPLDHQFTTAKLNRRTVTEVSQVRPMTQKQLELMLSRPF